MTFPGSPGTSSMRGVEHQATKVWASRECHKKPGHQARGLASDLPSSLVASPPHPQLEVVGLGEASVASRDCEAATEALAAAATSGF